MRNVSTAFLVGFAIVSFAGAGVAQTGADAPSASIATTLSSQAASLSGAAKSSVKLNLPSEKGMFEGASGAAAIGLANSLKDTGLVGQDSIANAKLGIAKGQLSGTDSTSVFKNALSSSSLSNALQGASGSSDTTADVKAVVALGVGTNSFTGALGSQKEVATQRLGK